MLAAITTDPEVMHGVPVFRGTRVPVQTMFEYLEGGDSLEVFLEGFPTVSRELAIQVLEECKLLRLAKVQFPLLPNRCEGVWRLGTPGLRCASARGCPRGLFAASG